MRKEDFDNLTSFDKKSVDLSDNALRLFNLRQIGCKSKQNLTLGMAPFHLELNPTCKCPLHCKWCSYKKRNSNSDSLNYKTIKDILGDAKEGDVKAVYFSGGGEPLLYEKINDCIELASEFARISIQTNGLLLDRILDQLGSIELITVSIYGHNSSTYKNNTRLNKSGFERLEKNLTQIMNSGPIRPHVSAKLLITPQNYKDTIATLKFLDRFNFDTVHLRLSTNYEDQTTNSLTHAQRKEFQQILTSNLPFLSGRIKEHAKTLLDQLCSSTKATIPPKCFVVKYGLAAVIEPWGDCYPCIAYDGHPGYVLGNVNEKRFSNIWGSEKHIEVVSSIWNSICYCECRHKQQNQRIAKWMEWLNSEDPLAWQI